MNHVFIKIKHGANITISYNFRELVTLSMPLADLLMVELSVKSTRCNAVNIWMRDLCIWVSFVCTISN